MTSADHPVALAYDELAGQYDEQLANNPVARYMRSEVQAHLARLYRKGDRVLDFTAGTGQDACFLARRGVKITALDASSAMIAELARAVSAGHLPVESRVLLAEQLGELEGVGFDGAFSTFAGINTVEDVAGLARNLHACLRPGARVLLHGLNQFCLWESIGRRSWAARRARTIWLGGTPVLHQFYNPFELWRSAFRDYFELHRVYGLSVIASPALVSRFPRAAGAAFAFDRVAGRCLPAAGDMYVLELERRYG